MRPVAVDGVLVIREERIAFASAGVAAMLGLPAGELVGRRFAEFLPPEERDVIVERHRRRLRGEPVAAEYELTALGAGGRTLHVEIQATLDADREVVVRLRDLTDQAERRVRLASLAALGVTLQAEGSAAAVEARVRDALVELGLICALVRPEGAGFRVAWSGMRPALRQAVEAALGAPVDGLVGPWSRLGRSVWAEGHAYTDDWITVAAALVPPDRFEQVRALATPDGPLRAAAVRLDQREGPGSVLLVMGAWLRPADLPALRLFGAQVAAALDSARAISALARRSADLEALASLAMTLLDASDGGTPQLLQAACAIAARSFEVEEAGVLLLDEQAGTLSAAAWHGGTAPGPGALAGWPVAARALSSGLPVAREDAPEGLPPGCGALLAVPVASRSRRHGVLVLRHGSPRPFPAADRTLATAMGGELAMALQYAEHHQEARRRAEELALMQDVGRSLVGSLEPQAVLEAGVANLARIVDAPAVYLTLLDPDGRLMRIAAVAGPHPEAQGTVIPNDPATSLAAAAMAAGAPLVLDDAAADPRRVRSLTAMTGVHSALVVPLLVRGAGIGAVFIAEHRRRRTFTPQEVQRASAVANQLAVAVDNARAHAKALAALADLERAQGRLVHRERLAALGELSAVVAHEVRNPLGVIFNSVGALRRHVPAEGQARQLLDMVAEEADRLDRMVEELLGFARPSAPELRLEPLERVVEEALSAALSRPSRGGAGGAPASPVEVSRGYAPGLPPVPLDPRQARQILVNLLTNALQAMPRGGRLRLGTRAEPGWAVLEIEDDGPGIPASVRHRIFEPFFTTKAAGTGLGLAVVKRLLDGHGATIAFASREGRGTVTTVRFPLAADPVEMGGGIS